MEAIALRPQSSVLVLAVLAVLAPSLSACAGASADAPSAPPPIPVRVETPGAGAVEQVQSFSATVAPVTQVNVAFRSSGYVESIGTITPIGGPRRPLREGDRVRRGQVLARLRGVDFDHALGASQAALAQAAAERELARADRDRARGLWVSGAVTRAELDAAEARARGTEAAARAASAHVREAALARGDSTLRAPFDGVVLRRSVEEGALVAAGSPAFVIADMRSVEVVFGVPDVAVGALRPGLELDVTGDAIETPRRARVIEIAPDADDRGRLFRVEAHIDNADGELRPGMVVSVRVGPRAPERERRMLVPLDALVRPPSDPRGFAVFVVEGERHPRAHRRVVRLGGLVGNAVAVESGLRPTERVVSCGASLLDDGDVVTIVD